MNERRRVLFLILIMAVIVLTVGGVSITLLYRTAFEEERARLIEMAESQARQMDSITRFVRVNDKDYPGGIEKAVLDQVRQAYIFYNNYKFIGEFVIAKREGSNMVFLVYLDQTNYQESLYIPFSSKLAEPMRQALTGKSGTMIGLDYSGEKVLAAHEPVRELDMGVVAKIDMKDIRAPFILAAFITLMTALAMIFLGVILFFRVTSPMIAHLADSEKRFRLLVEGVKDYAIFMLDPGGRVTTWNEGAVHITGYMGREIIGRHFSCFFTAEDNEKNRPANDLLAASTEGHFEDEGWRVRKDGSKFWANVMLTAIFDEKGRLIGFSKIMRDMTERKQNEDKVRESEETLRILLDAIPERAFLVDINLNFIAINHAIMQSLGKNSGDLIGRYAFGFFPPQIAEIRKDKVEQVIKTGRSLYFDDSNAGRDFINHIAPIFDSAGKVSRIAVVAFEITERKRAEEALRESEARFRLTFDQSPIGAALSTLDYRFIRVNDELSRFLGYSAEEFKNLTFRDITHPEELDRDALQIKRLLDGEIEQYIVDKRYVRKDGKTVWGHLSISMLKDAAGRPLYFLPMIEDISERKLAQTELEESEELYRGLVTAIPDIIVRTDINGQILYTNGVVLHKWGGLNTREFLGKNIFELIDPSDKDKALENNKLMIEKSIGPREYKLVLSDAVKIDFEVNGDVLCGADGSPYGFVYIVRDISERKLTEERIQSSLKEKEALLRELYHRTKNNMQVIIALLQLHASKTVDNQVKSVFREMADRIQSMALVHQKLYQSKNLSSIDFREYITDLANLLLASYSIKVEKIKLILDVEKLLVQIDLAIPCGLILSELVSNSLKHAFPGERQGEIRISLHKTPDNVIELIAADNGVGVPEGFDFRNSVKMGIQSVFAIGEHQLRGEVQFESRGGVICTLRFHEYDQDKV